MLRTFNTPFGRLKWIRIPFSISPTGEIFQQRLDQAIDGLDGVRTVADDVLITGNGTTVHDAMTDHDEKLMNWDELSPDKIELKETSIPYIGYVLTSDSVKADPAKLQAILEMKQPDDVGGVRRVLGTVNYLAKFLSHLSQVSESLRQLTEKDQLDTRRSLRRNQEVNHWTISPQVLRARKAVGVCNVMLAIMDWKQHLSKEENPLHLQVKH